MKLAAEQHLVGQTGFVAADGPVKREVVALVDGAAWRANDVVALPVAAELIPVDGADVRRVLERLPDAREVDSAALGSAAVREVPRRLRSLTCSG